MIKVKISLSDGTVIEGYGEVVRKQEVVYGVEAPEVKDIMFEGDKIPSFPHKRRIVEFVDVNMHEFKVVKTNLDNEMRFMRSEHERRKHYLYDPPPSIEKIWNTPVNVNATVDETKQTKPSDAEIAAKSSLANTIYKNDSFKDSSEKIESKGLIPRD